MAKVIAVTEAIKNLAEVESRFGLSRSIEATFSTEWQGSLPELTSGQQREVSVLWDRLNYQRSQGELLEGAVTLLAAFSLYAVPEDAAEVIRVLKHLGQTVLSDR